MASVRKREWIHGGQKKSAWCVEYTDIDGTRKRRTPKSGMKKDAEKLRIKIEQEIECGNHVPDGQSSIIRAITAEFLRHIEIRLKEGTIGTSRVRIMKQAIDGYLLPGLGGVPINRLTFVAAETWYDDMVAKGLSAATLKAYLLVAKMVVDFAIKRKMASVNPFTEVLHDRRGGGKSRIKTFDLEQIRVVLQAVDTPGFRCGRRPQALLKCAVHLAVFCGLRWGEIMGLTRENVDLRAGIVRVRHNLTHDDLLKDPKTAAGVRDVPMPEHVRIIMSDWLSRWATPEMRSLVFRRRDGTMIESRSFRTTWRLMLDRAGLGCKSDPFHFHALRHFAASFMIELGWPVTEVASLLGHSTFDVTLQVYAHPVVGGHRRQGMMQALADRALAAEASDRPPSALGTGSAGLSFASSDSVERH